VPKLPHLQGSLNAGYTANFGRYDLLSRIEYIYRGPFQYRIFNDGALDKVGGYSQWNLFFQLTPPDRRFTFSLGVSNLFNVAGINSRYTDPYGTGQTSDEYIPPRQVIGTVAYQF
jgi:iron complex outermembrane receptor protein